MDDDNTEACHQRERANRFVRGAVYFVEAGLEIVSNANLLFVIDSCVNNMRDNAKTSNRLSGDRPKLVETMRPRTADQVCDEQK